MRNSRSTTRASDIMHKDSLIIQEYSYTHKSGAHKRKMRECLWRTLLFCHRLSHARTCAVLLTYLIALRSLYQSPRSCKYTNQIIMNKSHFMWNGCAMKWSGILSLNRTKNMFVERFSNTICRFFVTHPLRKYPPSVKAYDIWI